MAVSKIIGDSAEYNKNLDNQTLFNAYQDMCNIVLHSAETFIQEDFDIVVFGDDVESYQEIFHKNFASVYEAWDIDSPNNVLFLDCDTLIISPTEVFGKYDRFQLFNYTDPKSLQGPDAKNKYNLAFDHYFNAGVRYYPDTMTKEVWDLGWSYASDWDYDIWGTEQIIFNEMMFSQDRDHTTWLKPEMNYQIPGVAFNSLGAYGKVHQLDRLNGCNVQDANILHLHGTRGALNTLLQQWVIWKQITNEEFEFDNFVVVKDSDGNATNLQQK